MGAVDFYQEEFRTKRAGFPDLLRYSSIIRPGIVLGKGGELIATFRYRGPDMECASNAELNLLRNRVANMVKQLVGGWMLHSTTLRKESLKYESNGAFPDVATQAIENERQAQYQAVEAHYENEYFLTFTYLPDAMLVSKIKDFAFESSEKGSMTPARLQDKTIAFFERQMLEYVGSLESSMQTKLVRLTAKQERDGGSHRLVWFDYQLAFLQECLTGRDQPVRLPAKVAPDGVNFLIGSYEFYPGIKPRLDDRFIRVVAIESTPDEGTQFGILDVLNELGLEFRWTTRWIARDPEKVKASVKRIRGKWRQKVHGIIADVTGKRTGSPNKDALDMANEADAVLNDIESGSVSYGMWTSVVVLMDKNAVYLEECVQYLLKTIRATGFMCRDEAVNCTEAFLGSLPGHGYENLRRPEIHSMNLADCLPLTSTWQGPVENPCPFYKKLYPKGIVPPLFHGSASGGTPFRVVLHNGDVGHAFIGGPTGAGKSTLLGLIAASHFRYPDAKLFLFEKGESMLALCHGVNGTHYNFLDDSTEVASTIGFAPFVQIDRLSDRIWAADYVEMILGLHDVTVDLDMRAGIAKAIDLLKTRPVQMRTLTTLCELVQIREVAQVLKLYEQNYSGGMLNFSSDTVSTDRFTVFEMEKLMGLDDRHAVPVLLYLFRMIERALDGSPTLIILDEAWLMLKHPMFQEKLLEWLKVLRKANASVIFATQELEDIADSPIASTIFSACQSRILLPNVEALKASKDLYRLIGLTEREMELLAYSTAKRDYFFSSPAGKRMFKLELGPVALAFVAASGTEDRAMAKRLHHVHGKNFAWHWLKHRGVDPMVLGEAARVAAEVA
ncbi:transporter [Janthinobacterium sp. CAN_S7]|uniref:TraG/VirB4 family ATPase n=1 Tax=Janthinobacterium sp. CAN_S7 TaxID=3071704 RepID=UPI00319EABF6